MKNKGLLWAIHAFVALSLTLGVEAMGQESRLPAHFNGLIDDYTPSNVKGGPYEMHGTWSLDLHRKGDSVIADFSATLNMETSDYGTQTPAPPATPNVDPTHPETRGPHTHHIALSAPVQFNATGCPTSTVAANPAPAPPPLTTSGFQFTGVVSLITGNGRQAPFEPLPPSPPTSHLTVCVTGGSAIQFSNVTMVFGAPASGHFGTQAVNGVVRTIGPPIEANERPW